MTAFLKTLIGGALGVSALYVVGKVCYEVGKDVAEIERQLERSEETDSEFEDHVAQIKRDIDEDLGPSDSVEGNANVVDVKEVKSSMFEKLADKVKNAKMFMTAKKAFDKSNKKPGILSSLLTNPDGAKIEAVVRDGGVQISVKPRAA